MQRWPCCLPTVVLLALSTFCIAVAKDLPAGGHERWIELVEPAYRDAVGRVVRDPSLQVRAAPESFPGALSTYEQLLYAPHRVARLWAAVGFADTLVRRSDDGWFVAQDPRGNRGRWRFVYQGQTLAVAYGEGMYRSPLGARSLSFETVVAWRYLDWSVGGRTYLTHEATAWFRLRHPAQHRLLQLVRPMAVPLAHRRLREAMLSLAIPVRLEAENPPKFRAWLEHAGLSAPKALASQQPPSPRPGE